MATSPLSISKHFAVLKDPRVRGRCQHRLLDIIVIAICGVISGCDDWPQIELFGKARYDWLKQFLLLPNGIPSHDTFERIFERLSPQAFQQCFCQWTRRLCAELGLEHIAIDGKSLCGSARESGLGALHLVSAWATKNQLMLGQVAVDKKSNEITAIPKLLQLLDLEGALVTIDAMGCQKKIAAQIVDQGGDYLLVVKDNQPGLYQKISEAFIAHADADFSAPGLRRHKTVEEGHGRQESREHFIVDAPEELKAAGEWKELKSIGMVERIRIVNGAASEEIVYYISSMVPKVKAFAAGARGHWGIENNLHWSVDVTFGEDKSRIQKRHAAENFAILRRIALNLLKCHSSKTSLRGKRKLAAWDTDFLHEVLNPPEIG